MTGLRAAFVTLFLALAAAGAVAEDAGPIAVSQVWARPSLAGARTDAAYLAITNRGKRADRLVAVSTPVAEKAEVHLEEMANGVMRMRPLPDLPVPAGQTVMLEPGGKHLMLIGLKQPLKPGESFPLTLTFETAGTLTVTATVGTAAPAEHHHPS